MSINQRLDLRQGQTLTMTPQLQQAIKLLQMSNLELAEFVAAELEKNPLLERDDGPEGGSEAAPAAAQEAPASDAPVPDAETMMGGMEGYDAFATQSFAGVGKGGSLAFDDSDYSLENTLAEERSLRAHLAEQIEIGFPDAASRAVAFALLDHLDESGYFRAGTDAVAERLGSTEERVTQVLERLQHFDPPGIFARNLRECLSLQLRERNRLDPAMRALLDNLDALAAGDMKKLKALCAVDGDDLRDMIAEIKSLDPKPALAFDHFVTQTVIPDVLMRPLPKTRGGGWAVELNSDTLPRVLVNRSYYAEVTKGARGKEDREYLAAQMNTAGWLVKAMDQRARTILKVAGEVIRQQEAFFNYGVEYLRPMALKDIAREIEMHESTVSRVTSNKYIGTPRGVFELKYFFSSGVSAVEGDNTWSAEAVKARIRALVEAENPQVVLSDDDLVKALTSGGIDIARRTVAKYREAMGIPSSVQRRRQKKS